MKVFKGGLLSALVVVFAIACSTSEINRNAHNANQPSPATANSNSGAAATAANSNTGAASEPASAKPPADSKATAKVDAAALFVAQKCVGCHGADGKGKVKGAPNFTDAAWQKKEPDAELAEAIKKGNVPKMPAYATKLSDDEVKALVAYVRTFSGK